MTSRALEPAPPTAVRSVGVLYLLATATAVFTALGIAGFGLGVLFMLTRLLSPMFLTAGIAVIRALPPVPLVLFAMSLASLASFGVTLGLWLLVERVRKPA
jgi:hypothetical protein